MQRFKNKTSYTTNHLEEPFSLVPSPKNRQKIQWDMGRIPCSYRPHLVQFNLWGLGGILSHEGDPCCEVSRDVFPIGKLHLHMTKEQEVKRLRIVRVNSDDCVSPGLNQLPSFVSAPSNC